MPHVSFQELVNEVIIGDRLISFPTDTVPALASRLDRTQLIFTAKQRSLDKPLILMTGDVADLWQYVVGTSAELQIWQAVAEQYLPGALTLVLPASDRVPSTLNPQNPSSIGVRVPNHPIARAILNQTGALATTSVNRSGTPPLQTIPEINQQFPDVLTLSPSEVASFEVKQPDGVAAFGLPSTVVRWTGQTWQVLRQGAIVLEEAR